MNPMLLECSEMHMSMYAVSLVFINKLVALDAEYIHFCVISSAFCSILDYSLLVFVLACF